VSIGRIDGSTYHQSIRVLVMVRQPDTIPLVSAQETQMSPPNSSVDQPVARFDKPYEPGGDASDARLTLSLAAVTAMESGTRDFSTPEKGSSVPNLELTEKKTDVTAQKDAPSQLIGPGDAFTINQNLDSNSSPADLVKSGAISEVQDKRKVVGSDRSREVKPEGDTQTPKISVELQNLVDPTKNPNFVIKENGQIEMQGNPELLKSKDISIVLQRRDGQLDPTAKQLEATDRLVKYLSERVQSQNPQARAKGIELNDKDNVVLSQTERETNLYVPKALRNFTQQTQESIQYMHRVKGITGLDMPRTQTDGMGSIGTRTVPALPGETKHESAIKESIAGLFQPDKASVYETIRQHPDGQYKVGRYGLSGEQLRGFADNLGNPPNAQTIDVLVQHGRLPREFGEKLKNPAFLQQFKDFADKLNRGQQPTKAELNEFLPKEVQEGITSRLLDSYRARLGDRAGETTAAMLLGRAPENLSSADLNSAEGKQLKQAGRQLYDVIRGRQKTDGNERGEGRTVGRIPQGERRATIEKGLELAGVEPSARNLAAVNLIIEKESSWNPNIVNNWDSNARKGTPSKGLMQTIGPTFNAHKVPGHNDIFNPVHNLAAGVRYAIHRYGSLDNVPGVKAVTQGRRYRGY
jgi:hypothetical protein